MGYRLEVSELKYKMCCGKLFGYVDTYNLESYRWLVDNNYLSGDKLEEYFDYGYEGNIVLSAEKFKEFIEIYIKDLKKHKMPDFIEDKDIEEIVKNDNYVILQWG